jgi:hypothetical protein
LSEFNAKNATGKDSWEEEVSASKISKKEFYTQWQTVFSRKPELSTVYTNQTLVKYRKAALAAKKRCGGNSPKNPP